MTGIKTIRQGERVVVWNKSGRVRFVNGLHRLWLLQMPVDLVLYLVAQHRHPDRLIWIDGDSARLHLHDQ